MEAARCIGAVQNLIRVQPEIIMADVKPEIHVVETAKQFAKFNGDRHICGFELV